MLFTLTMHVVFTASSDDKAFVKCAYVGNIKFIKLTHRANIAVEKMVDVL